MAGREEDCDLLGESCIVAPTGEIVAQDGTLGDEPIVAEADLDRCREIQDNVFNFALHREPQNYSLISRPKDAAEGGDDARANPKRGGETG